MSSLTKIIGREIATTIARPSRLLNVFSTHRWQIFLGFNKTQLQISDKWSQTEGSTGTSQRRYSSYEQYLDHQRSILGLINLTDYDKEFRPALRDRIAKHSLVNRGDGVLCLAARVGTEVKAFRDLGCFAVGTDITVRPENPWVLYGDFHDVQFADQSVDLVYTNSFDHVFDIEKVVGEIARTVKQGGTFVMEVAFGAKQGGRPGPYEAFWWDSVDELAQIVERAGFAQRLKDTFEVPWPGEMRVFTRNR